LKERKTRVCAKITGAFDFVCVRYYDGRELPVVAFMKWYDGKSHKKKVGEFGTIANALSQIAEYIKNNERMFER